MAAEAQVRQRQPKRGWAAARVAVATALALLMLVQLVDGAVGSLMGGTSISGNSSGDRGGGVLNRGTLVMAQDASITRNRAATVGGGLYDRGTSVGVVCGRNVRGNAPDDCARP